MPPPIISYLSFPTILSHGFFVPRYQVQAWQAATSGRCRHTQPRFRHPTWRQSQDFACCYGVQTFEAIGRVQTVVIEKD